MDTKSKKSSAGYRVAVTVTVISAIILILSLYAFFAIDDIHYIFMEAERETYRRILENVAGTVLTIGVVSGLTGFICLVISAFCIGKKDETGEIYMNWFDRVYMELKLIVSVLLVFPFIFIVERSIEALIHSGLAFSILSVFGIDKSLYSEYAYYGYVGGLVPDWLVLWVGLLAEIIIVVIYIAVFLSVVKHIKNHSFLKNFAIVEGMMKLVDTMRRSERTEFVVMAVLLAGIIISATVFGSIVVLLLTLIFIPKLLSQYREIRKGVKAVKEGEVSYKIPVTSKTDLGRLAEDINTVSSATELAIEKELKHQKLKTDLISNVSHDLKTPLTSMISYVDLLKREGLDSENAEEYLKIIDEKTKRLKSLTENLFEAAKASSGEIPVNKTKIQVSALVNQAVAELEERFNQHGLEVIYENNAERDEVVSDGQLLWRVIENLLVNVSKYALENSRVYIDLYDSNENIIMEIKNISRERLNISVDELMERFTRGDDARNTEGSGLGLAIAKDLTNLIGGNFQLSIDGDLFKASLILPKGE